MNLTCCSMRFYRPHYAHSKQLHLLEVVISVVCIGSHVGIYRFMGNDHPAAMQRMEHML